MAKGSPWSARNNEFIASFDTVFIPLHYSDTAMGASIAQRQPDGQDGKNFADPKKSPGGCSNAIDMARVMLSQHA